MLRVCLVREETMMTGKLEGKGVVWRPAPQAPPSTGSSGVLLGTAKGLMASYRQATNKIKKFLEI